LQDKLLQGKFLQRVPGLESDVLSPKMKTGQMKSFAAEGANCNRKTERTLMMTRFGHFLTIIFLFTAHVLAQNTPRSQRWTGQ